MSDSCMYQIDDFTWDEFGESESEDHIVPYPSDERQDVHKVQDHCKRPRYEFTSALNSDESKSTRNISQCKEGRSTPALKEIRETMPEKGPEPGPGPCSSNGIFPASHDISSNKMASGTASEADGAPKYCLETSKANSISEELCDDDPILGDQVENNSFHYQLNQLSEPVSDLSFFNNAQQDKESGDLLYYGWPEIENFEDVDKMFRSCDSTFGLGIDNEDELSWFSSAQAIEESNDTLKQSFKFPASDSHVLGDVADYDGISRMNNADCLVDETDKKAMPFCQNSSSEKPDANDADVVMQSSFENGSEATTQVGARSQYVIHESQKKLQVPTDCKRRGSYLENGECFIHLNKLNQMGDPEQCLGDSSYHYSSSPNIQHEQSNEPQNDVETPLPLICSTYDHQSSQLLTSTKVSTIKSEDNVQQSLSQNESSYASNQMQTLERCNDVSLQIPGVTSGKRKAQSKREGFSVHYDHAGLPVQSASSDPVTVQKQVVNFESEVDGNSGIDGNDPSIPAELDSSNVQESACLSSMVDEVSLEASSFLQLQHVMEKLDVKTKLCIRDSLYRLAKSAEHRHKCVELTGGGQGDKDVTRVLASAETNKCTGFMDMETDTNPIDRSVAHLLFHRPSDPSAVPAVATMPLTMVRTTNNAAPGATEKPVSQESSNEDGTAVAAATAENSNLC